MSEQSGGTLRVYFAVFAALCALTLLTVWSSAQPLGAWHTPVALMIASIKGMLVILYFMHVRWSSRLTWVFAGVGFLFLAILLAFTLSDFVTRDWLELYG